VERENLTENLEEKRRKAETLKIMLLALSKSAFRSVIIKKRPGVAIQTEGDKALLTRTAQRMVLMCAIKVEKKEQRNPKERRRGGVSVGVKKFSLSFFFLSSEVSCSCHRRHLGLRNHRLLLLLLAAVFVFVIKFDPKKKK